MFNASYHDEMESKSSLEGTKSVERLRLTSVVRELNVFKLSVYHSCGLELRSRLTDLSVSSRHDEDTGDKEELNGTAAALGFDHQNYYYYCYYYHHTFYYKLKTLTLSHRQH